MAPLLSIKWMACGRDANGSTLPSETPVYVQSRHTQNPPRQYRIERLIPKPIWKIWARQTIDVTVWDAISVNAGPTDPGGLYESRPEWVLPVVGGQVGYAQFRAWTDSGDAYSGLLGSARLWIEEVSRVSQSRGDVGAYVPGALPIATVFRPRIAVDRTKQVKWVTRAPVDPEVRIRLLQGPEVFDYLQAVDAEMRDSVDFSPGSLFSFPTDTMTYFVDQPLDDTSIDTSVGPESPAEVEAHLPDVADLRAAIALEVLNLEDESVIRSSPVFATRVGDRVILTDLTIDMLRDQAREILTELADANGSVDNLAAARGEDAGEVWERLVEATQELGAGSVGEAAALFATMGTRTTAGA